MTLDLSSAFDTEVGNDSGYYFHSKLARPVLQGEDPSEDATYAAAKQGESVIENDEDGRGSESSGSEAMEPQASKSKRQVQILGLESPEPLVSFGGQVFRCSWHTGLGTDMMFCAPERSPADVEPLIKDSKFHLLANTNIKLIGTRVLVTKLEKDNHIDPRVEDRAAATQGEPLTRNTDHDSEATPSRKRANPYSILLEEGATEARKKQASFLENLMAIKAARNEKDEVYLGRGKQYRVHGEKEPRAGRQLPSRDPKPIPGEEEREDVDVQPGENQQQQVRYGGRRSSTKRLQKPGGALKSSMASRGGGLFRDFMLEDDGDQQRAAQPKGDATELLPSPTPLLPDDGKLLQLGTDNILSSDASYFLQTDNLARQSNGFARLSHEHTASQPQGKD